MTPSASTPRTCPLSIRTTGALVGVEYADAAPSIAAAASRTAKKRPKILCTRGCSQWRCENGDATSIFARSHWPVDGANSDRIVAPHYVTLRANDGIAGDQAAIAAGRACVVALFFH